MGKIDYQFFYFEPFDLHEMNIATNGIIPEGVQHDAYTAWIEWYHHHAGLFYYDQYWQYTNKVYENFIREHDLPDDGGESIGQSERLQGLYDQAQEDAEIEYQHNRFHDFMDRINRLYGQYHKGSKSLQVTAMELLEDFLSEKPIGRSYLNLITEAWFNHRISNTATQIQQLRQMPYDAYLKTPHWYKVRALTLFTYRAMCASTDCQGHSDQMWIAYAHHRQVHHISYANRGNERFGDVCVLCKACHTKVHNGKKELLTEDCTHIWF